MRGQVLSRKRVGVALLLALLVSVALAWSIDGIRWRLQVAGLKAAGNLDDIGWAEMALMMRPGSPYSLEPLRENSNAFAVILNPHDSPADRQAGEQLFGEYCALCHGPKGEAGPAPSLLGTFKMGDSDWALFRTISGRVRELTMPPVPLPEKETWQVVSYLRALRSPVETTPVHPSGRRSAAIGPVPVSRIEAALTEPQNWLTYSGSYQSWRHSLLDQINSDNVGTLKLAWSLQLDTREFVEASPVVVDGVMYVTEPPSNVRAVEAATGRTIWRYERSVPNDVPACCGRVNRGIAIADDRVYVGTLDGFLVALDASTGSVEFETKVADYKDGYTITAAPLAVKNKVVVGIAGGEYGTRGFLDAYDADSGELSWRFFTIPEPGTKGSETWEGKSWRTGGGPTWITGSFDPALNLVYWGIGNPAPDFNGDPRPGDNLFTNSVVALDVDSGELAWHFQFTPHDERDWDSNQIPVLADLEIAGELRRLMLWANRNGHYYLLDRETGEFLLATPFVKQNWAEFIDARGRPVLKPNAQPSTRGTLSWPGPSGGANWWSPSYSPGANLFFVPFHEAPKIMFKGVGENIAERRRGAPFLGGSYTSTGDPLQSGVRALDPTTGRVVWEFMSGPIEGDVGIAGVLSTAGNVAFFGMINDFIAVDARTGRQLWRTNLGGRINANPVTFAVEGRQLVVIPAGNVFYAFAR